MEVVMSVKSDILRILLENKAEPISGEAIAIRLNVSRAYVWKTIRKLKEEGYHITATQNLGYILTQESDLISKEGIQSFLRKDYYSNDVLVYKTIDSTNTEAKKLAVAGASHGTVVLSEEQTEGRGRRGRSFFSPNGNGIYMSLILRPNLNVQDSVLITTAASVAVSRAIKKVTNLDTQIKWVNDLYMNGKKICGILTEAVTDCDTGCIDSIILGIGINFSLKSNRIPEELKHTIGSLYETKPDHLTRNQLCAEIITQVLDLCQQLSDRTFLEEYKTKSLVIGQHILILGNTIQESGIAIDINSSGGLIVQMDSGEIRTLNSGEITIRTIKQ